MCAAAFACIAMAPLAASASPTDAQERFEQGRALVQAHRIEEAVMMFRESIAIQPTAAALLNLADCYERLGKTATAHATFRQAEALGKTPERVEEARRRATALEPLSAIVITKPSLGAEASVWIDGARVTESAFGHPIPHDPGAHEIVIARGGDEREVRAVRLGPAGHRVVVDVATNAAALREAPARHQPQAVHDRPSASTGTERTPRMSTARKLALASGGVGIAGVAVGSILGGIALSNAAELKNSCATYPQCPDERREELTALDERARMQATGSTIALVAGGALLVLGAALLIATPTSSGPLTSRWRSTPAAWSF